MSNFEITPIGKIESPFKEKFGVPRQPGLTNLSQAKIVFDDTNFSRAALRGIEGFSHIWILFLFDQVQLQRPNPLVRPPRLGGNQKLGVYATRSPFRINRIGQSLVRIGQLEDSDGPIALTFFGGDMVDKTPVIDIKPFIPYCDTPQGEMRSGWVSKASNERLLVKFEERLIQQYSSRFLDEISEVLSLDPRPRYHQDGRQEYGMIYQNVNIRFEISGKIVNVNKIEPLTSLESHS